MLAEGLNFSMIWQTESNIEDLHVIKDRRNLSDCLCMHSYQFDQAVVLQPGMSAFDMGLVLNISFWVGEQVRVGVRAEAGVEVVSEHSGMKLG